MLKNYLKVALRNILRNKVYSFLNIFGLAIGVACFLLIYMFVRFELSYDQFHEKSDRIYRIAVRALIGDTKIHQTNSSAITFTRLLEEFPEIESGVKFLNFGKTPVILGEKIFYESQFYAVDSTFFSTFTSPLVHGDPNKVLNQPNTMVITREMALKYFGHTDVIGNILQVEVSRTRGIVDFMITGVSEELPENSHFHFNILISLITFPDLLNNQGWTMNNFVSYILLREGSSAVQLETKLAEFTREYMGGDEFDAWVAKGNNWEFFLQPITKIHLTSDLNGEFEANGNETYVYIFSVISAIVLLIASINFMNLSTAKSSLRAKEVGMRKVVGSNRARLIGQFLTESLFLSFISLLCGLLIVESLLPVYQDFIGKNLQIHYFGDVKVIPALLLLGLLIGIVSGSYPAFVLSGFRPIQVIAGNLHRGKRGLWFRNILVLIQFTISIFLIIGTIIVFQQLKHFQNKNLGFDKEQILVIKNPSSLGHTINLLKESMGKNQQIINVSGSNTLPGRSFSNRGFGAEGLDGGFTLNVCVCDEKFLKTLKINLIAGRFFSREFVSDSSAIVLNQKAVELLGWKDPIGKRIIIWDENKTKFTVIGVIEDYHYESLHQEVRPLGLFLAGGYFKRNENFISVRLRTENIAGTIDFVRHTWNKFLPQKPFEYSFLDEDYNSLYLNEEQTRKLFSIFSFLAIFIACLGLFGLASFSAQRRTREVGIRKALGASFTNIILILNQEFLKWVLIANLIAWPLAYYFMNNWLQNFAYRITLTWWVFLLGAIVALLIAVFTVSFQSIKAALTNPSEALRYE